MPRPIPDYIFEHSPFRLEVRPTSLSPASAAEAGHPNHGGPGVTIHKWEFSTLCEDVDWDESDVDVWYWGIAWGAHPNKEKAIREGLSRAIALMDEYLQDIEHDIATCKSSIPQCRRIVMDHAFEKPLKPFYEVYVDAAEAGFKWTAWVYREGRWTEDDREDALREEIGSGQAATRAEAFAAGMQSFRDLVARVRAEMETELRSVLIAD